MMKTIKPKETMQSRSRLNRMFRTVGPAIPLGIALLHAASTRVPTKPATATPQTTVSQSSKTTCNAAGCAAPMPLLRNGHAVEWWFVFKLNSGKFPQCGDGDTRTCPFGGTVQQTTSYKNFGQQFVYASSEKPSLQDGGKECMGTTKEDPVGATFDEVYNGKFHYVVWNDQPYGDPDGECSGNSCSAPWAHSKGMLAWNDRGEGLVMQVSTPSWPLAASSKFPRKTDGNTLGCIRDNDVNVSQHFFALHLSKPDVVLMLQALTNASAVTDPKNPQVVNNGGPSDIQELVNGLGTISDSKSVITGMLSSGAELIAKPSKLHVPPWQMISSELGGVSLRVATWWIDPGAIPSTKDETPISCWDASLEKPGAVEVATGGKWGGIEFGLKGGNNPNGNHAKFAVSTSTRTNYVIFGDMNQDGALDDKDDCSASQNGRGGLFFVMKNAQLAKSVSSLIAGESAPF